jgi:hypothetical protein
MFAFSAFVMFVGTQCPCPAVAQSHPDAFKCLRDEQDAAISHFLAYAVLGYLYPAQFVFWQSLGVFWELVELFLDRNQDYLKYVGGCVAESDRKKNVGNVIDRVLHISPTQNHVWHPSASDIVYNIFGFIVGNMIGKFYHK